MKSILPILALVTILFLPSCKDKGGTPDAQEGDIGCNVSSIKDTVSNLTFQRNEKGQIVSASGFTLRSISGENTQNTKTYLFTYDDEGRLETMDNDDIEMEFFYSNTMRPDSASLYDNNFGTTIMLYFQWNANDITELIYKQKFGTYLIRHSFTYENGNLSIWAVDQFNLGISDWSKLSTLTVSELDDKQNFALNDLALQFLFFDAISLGKNNIVEFSLNGDANTSTIQYDDSGNMIFWEIIADSNPSTVRNTVEIGYKCE